MNVDLHALGLAAKWPSSRSSSRTGRSSNGASSAANASDAP